MGTASKEPSVEVLDCRSSDVNHTNPDAAIPPVTAMRQYNSGLYLAAITRYPNDESIKEEEEKRLKRKLDRRILPVLGICYFFYVCLREYLRQTHGADGRSLVVC